MHMAIHSYPRGQHYQQRARSARVLRAEAAEMSENIATLDHWICERADEYGWDDSLVQSGCVEAERLKQERATLIARAREIDTTFYRV